MKHLYTAYYKFYNPITKAPCVVPGIGLISEDEKEVISYANKKKKQDDVECVWVEHKASETVYDWKRPRPQLKEATLTPTPKERQ